MNKIHAQEDLSGWLSPDEERLLNLYRDGTANERDEWIYRVTRRRLAHMFSENFDDDCDARDASYLHEELEQWLREICPVHLFGDYLCENPHLSTLVRTAWGGAGRVLLGFSESDGQRADELFNSAIRLWDMIGRGPGYRRPLDFDRKAALTVIECWRNAALAHAYGKAENRS